VQVVRLDVIASLVDLLQGPQYCVTRQTTCQANTTVPPEGLSIGRLILLLVYLVTGQTYRSKYTLVQRIVCKFGWQPPRGVSIHQKFTSQIIEMESLLKASENIPCFCSYPNITPFANLPRPGYFKTGYGILDCFGKAFLWGILKWCGIGTLASYTNAMIKFLQSKVSIAFRTRLTRLIPNRQ
jgi:hypothetical protein